MPAGDSPRWLPPIEDWGDEAVCRTTERVDFFPQYPRGIGAREREVLDRPAKILCAQCPVRDECLDYAQHNRIELGIWGGLNEVERRRLRRGK